MSDISKATEKLAAMLKSKGFVEQAAELESIAAWMPQLRAPSPGRREPEDVVPDKSKLVGEVDVAKDLVTGKLVVTPPEKDKDGEVSDSYKKLSPDEKKKHKELTNLVNYYYSGASNERKQDILNRIEEVRKSKYITQVTPEYKTQTAPEYIGRIPQSELGKFHALSRLATVHSKLSSMGYDSLANRIRGNFFRLMEAAIKDLHQIMSIEALHERSGDHKEFEENIKKLAEMHEDAAKVVREFDREYISKVMNKKDLSEEEAVKETVQMIREADGKVSAKVMELERLMKFKKP